MGCTVNTIQDKWPDEFIGLMAEGMRIGPRQATGMKELPIDAAIVGLIDHVEAFSKQLYKAGK